MAFGLIEVDQGTQSCPQHHPQSFIGTVQKASVGAGVIVAMLWRTVAAGAVLGAAATKLLLSHSKAPHSSRPSHSGPSVTFAAGQHDGKRQPVCFCRRFLHTRLGDGCLSHACPHNSASCMERHADAAQVELRVIALQTHCASVQVEQTMQRCCQWRRRRALHSKRSSRYIGVATPLVIFRGCLCKPVHSVPKVNIACPAYWESKVECTSERSWKSHAGVCLTVSRARAPADAGVSWMCRPAAGASGAGSSRPSCWRCRWC